MAQVVVLLLLSIISSGALGDTECPQHCQTCVLNKPTECQDKRGLIPRPDCISCCVVCAKLLGESCDEKQNPCSNDLQCKNGKCEELPETLRPSTPPIELLSATAVNSSTARMVVRLPPSATSEVAVTMALQSTGPWTRVPHITNMTKEDGSIELIISGLEGTVHLFRVEHLELRSRAVRVELPVQDTTEAAKSCDYQGHEFQVGEAYLSTDCMERCECRSEGKFSCSETSPEASEACRGAARKLNIIQVMDSTEDSVSLKWSGPAGVVLQSRAIGTTGPWQRAERLTPDGSESPSNVTLSSLQPFTTYEIRAVLPGAEEGRSSRGEDSPPMASATTKPGPGQGDAGFCVVLGRKIATGEEIPTPNGSCSDQKCMCMPGQPPTCKPRCAVPFFKRGAFSDDPLCEEKPSPDDPCCVLLTCADNSLVTEEGGHDPCEQCGANAECHKSMVTSMADEALCMCKDGYIGDPYDKKEGCKLTAVHAVSSKGGDLDKMDRCFFKNMTYSPGDHFTDGCEHLCSCTVQIEIMCKPRCAPVPDSMGPGCKLVTDPKDECCRVVMCETEKSKTEAGIPLAAGELFDGCKYKNKTYQRDEKFEDGCEKLCTCNTNGDVFCKPRCAPPPSNKSDKCVTLRDPHDSCCTVVLCDVTLADQEVMKVSASNIEAESNNSTKTTTPITPLTPRIAIEMAEAVNASAARLIAKFPQGGDWPKGAPEVAVFVAHAKDGPWTKAPGLAVSQTEKGFLQLTVAGLEPGPAHLRIEHGDMKSDIVEVKLPQAALGTTCEYKGKHYNRDDEFHDGCEMYCACTKTGVQCATIECPTDFGLDVLDPHCLDWEAEPDFVATPPRCCPDMRCRDNGSCTYRGSRFDNFAEIPTKLSGCEQRCYCEFGNVSCNPACPPVPATPPSTLQCSPSEARLAHLPGEECCRYWLCPQPQLPPAPAGFPNRPFAPGPFPPHSGNDLQLKTPQPLGPREVRLGFSVPPIYVGLHGRVEIRYTDDPTKEDPSTWQRASSTSDEIIESPQLVHEVSGLKPNTEYRIQVAMRLRDVDNELSSHVVGFRTPPEESLVSSTTLPPQIPIDAGLAVAEVNSTWMRVRWRKFNEYELQFIDGVQLRYKERDGKVYAATPLLYRLVDSYMLEDLRPGTEYEVGIFFIPFPGQSTELQAERSVQATTAPEQADPYGFDLALTVAMVKANSVELSWTGVPYPEDKYVNIYRAIYQSDLEVGKQELSSTFKLAKRDAPARTTVQDLKPNTRYRIWLEAYLTNGKIKKSDVRTFTTKPGALASAGASEQVASDAPRADYYGALVGVAIVAALAVVGLTILLMILVRRQSAASAAITPRPAKAEAAYDNPTYKTSDDLTPVNGSTNGSSKHHNPVHEEA